MTSSLVGSEMCIRDSLKGRQDMLRAWRPAAGLLDGTGLHDMLTYKMLQCCLLYTSDAADDM
eukprot:8120117-Prorocentrum_lima.AAC.1